jgi:arylsulfatase A-like enzyme
VLDALDAGNLWQDTAVIVCTDHGHYLGEKDAWGKPPLPLWEPIGHTPLFVAWPGRAPGACGALTTNVDLHATLLDVFGASSSHRTHGRSLVPLIEGTARSLRDCALAGYWGREVHWIDGERKYARAPAQANFPLSIWSNRWSTMPVHRAPQLRLPPPDARASLARMPGSAIPVLRQPFLAGDALPFWALGPFSGNHLYDLANDPAEQRNLAGRPEERRAEEALREALIALEAPAEQLERLGLA